MPKLNVTPEERALLVRHFEGMRAIEERKDKSFYRKPKGKLYKELASAFQVGGESLALTRPCLREIESWVNHLVEKTTYSVIPGYKVRIMNEKNESERTRLSNYCAKAQNKLDAVLHPMVQKINKAL